MKSSNHCTQENSNNSVCNNAPRTLAQWFEDTLSNIIDYGVTNNEPLPLSQLPNDILTVIAGYLNFSTQLSLRTINRSFHEDQAIRLTLLESVIRKFTITEVKTSYHTHVKMQSGHWYSWGCNRSGNLGFTTETYCLNTPRRNKTLEELNPDQYAIGCYHSVATKNDQLYCWGSNTSKQLGNGTSDHNTHHHPTQLTLPLNPAIIKISSTKNHNIIQTSSGIFSFGSNTFGQLGHGDERTERVGRISVFIPPVTIRHLACGNSHAIAQTDDQKVFAWGYNNRGQLGVGRERIRFSSPEPVEIETLRGQAIKQLGAASHSCALMQNGTVYMWGENQKGQLGLGGNDDVNVPTPLPLPFEVDAIQLKYMRSFFTEKLSSSQPQTVSHQKKQPRIYACGYNHYNQCGILNRQNQSRPVEIPFFKNTPLKILATGNLHTLVLSNNNLLYAIGHNCNGILGLGDKNRRSEFTPVLFFREQQEQTLKRLHLLHKYFSTKYGMNNISEKELIAATRIQRAFRDCFRLSHINAAITIQRIFKAYYFLPRHQAAIIIQRVFKAYRSKQANTATLSPLNVVLFSQKNDSDSPAKRQYPHEFTKR
jgi:alpha-tubulin suppressor-like RCC1 family protein